MATQSFKFIWGFVLLLIKTEHSGSKKRKVHTARLWLISELNHIASHVQIKSITNLNFRQNRIWLIDLQRSRAHSHMTRLEIGRKWWAPPTATDSSPIPFGLLAIPIFVFLDPTAQTEGSKKKHPSLMTVFFPPENNRLDTGVCHWQPVSCVAGSRRIECVHDTRRVTLNAPTIGSERSRKRVDDLETIRIFRANRFGETRVMIARGCAYCLSCFIGHHSLSLSLRARCVIESKKTSYFAINNETTLSYRASQNKDMTLRWESWKDKELHSTLREEANF